ncbi:VOC family protein [Chitinophaga parva]|nr:VOC family protein [Chitinophaga parva]
MSPQLLVKDIARAVQFYANALGFSVDFRYEDFYAGIIKDGYSIHLKVDGDNAEGKSSQGNSENVSIIFNISHIESLYDELCTEGISISQSLRDMPYGKEFYIADPDGNILAFLE